MTPNHQERRPRSRGAGLLEIGIVPATAFLLSIALLLLALTDEAHAQPLRVAVISDLNGSYGSTAYEESVDAAIARLLALQPDLVISTGDMVAGQRRPHLSRAELEAMWSAFHAHVSDPLAKARIPLAVTPGNHDGSVYQGFELERRIYAEQWKSRQPRLRFLDASHYPFYYAFGAGDVLFVSLDATAIGRLPGDQMRWLKGVLARQSAAFEQRVIFSHLPLWPFAAGREHDFIGDPPLEALLRRAGVRLYLSGHHHAFYPGQKDGIDYVSQSCLGAGPRRLIGTSERSPRSFTLIEMDGSKRHIAAYRAPDFTQPVAWGSLPEQIDSGVARLVRADLADPALTRLGRLPDPPGPRRVSLADQAKPSAVILRPDSSAP